MSVIHNQFKAWYRYESFQESYMNTGEEIYEINTETE